MADIVYEGLWNCSDCGKVRIPGTLKECPRCGDPQNSVLTPQENWYYPKNARVITDADELKDSDVPSWNCGHCGTLNDGGDNACSNCKKPLDYDDTVNRVVKYDDLSPHNDAIDPRDEMIESDLDRARRMVDTEGAPRVMNDQTRPASELPREREGNRIMDAALKGLDDMQGSGRGNIPTALVSGLKRHKTMIAILLVTVIMVTAVVGIMRWVNYYTATESGEVTISALHWERKVEVEKYVTLNQDGWTYPGDARVTGQDIRVQTYRTIHDGWRTETYTDSETRYRTESYIGTETRYRTESYTYSCPYTQSNGNGKFTQVQRSCSGTRSVPYSVSVPMTRQVPYQVPVQKTRQKEITHQEPVYATWYTFQVDRWMTDRWATASDVTSKQLIWPVPTDLKTNTQPGDQVGEERIGDQRSDSYSVVYADKNGVSRVELNEDDRMWSLLAQGEKVPARYYVHDGSLAGVDWPAA